MRRRRSQERSEKCADSQETRFNTASKDGEGKREESSKRQSTTKSLTPSAHVNKSCNRKEVDDGYSADAAKDRQFGKTGHESLRGRRGALSSTQEREVNAAKGQSAARDEQLPVRGRRLPTPRKSPLQEEGKVNDRTVTINEHPSKAVGTSSSANGFAHEVAHAVPRRVPTRIVRTSFRRWRPALSAQ